MLNQIIVGVVKSHGMAGITDCVGVWQKCDKGKEQKRFVAVLSACTAAFFLNNVKFLFANYVAILSVCLALLL